MHKNHVVVKFKKLGGIFPKVWTLSYLFSPLALWSNQSRGNAAGKIKTSHEGDLRLQGRWDDSLKFGF